MLDQAFPPQVGLKSHVRMRSLSICRLADGIASRFAGQSGKILYCERLGGPPQGYSASPASDARHLCFAGETGKVLVIPVGDTSRCFPIWAYITIRSGP